MSIAAGLRSLALGAAALENRLDKQTTLLNAVLDLHNDLTEWCVNTDHTEAAAEVMAILETYVQATQPNSEVSTLKSA